MKRAMRKYSQRGCLYGETKFMNTFKNIKWSE